ncbi:MurR/RpiR family transcriptional regulator [Fodinisporobacter ferrooxydans]|uniref:MurR/RpiR family transcriptional regulator n=1 Tax=Fodinisporobacter ferrooxydans TaxID=2901836 RepID=A0ABY4CI12_9BACL|nr:MurR/RpiR family transcriptional regulator [Alicyclobacillaceae bacterium MYW30-H2]
MKTRGEEFAQQGCLARIRYLYEHFTSTELKVAAYILEQPKDIIHLSITQLAELTECAEATIFRFCKRLGYEGYQALKISLAADLVTPLEGIHQEIDSNDSMAVIAKKIFTANAETLQDTLGVLDERELKKAVLMLAQASRVEFYGCGGSGPIAEDAYHKFVRTGIPCIALTDSHLQIVSAGILQSNCVAVGISHSGSNKDMIDVLEAAKQSGAATIAITDFAKSPLTKVSDIVLYTSSKESMFRTESMSSRLAQISILDTLYVGVSLTKKEEMFDNLSKVRNLIAHKRY